MTLNDLLKTGSLFGTINTIVPFEFFAEVAPEKMDSLLSLEYGDRTLFNKVENKTLDELAIDIVSTYQDTWKKAIELHLIDFNIGSGETRKVTETVDNTEERTNNREDLNKVSAFNSDDLVIDDGASSNGNESLDGNKTRTLTEEKINLNNAFTNLSLLVKSNIIKLVLKDVSNFTTLSIY